MQTGPQFTLKFLAALLSAAVIFVAAVTFVFRDEEIGWGIQYLEYKHHYASSLTEPKILFNGGCATLYGIRSSIAHDVTGFRAVNLGVSGGFSPGFHFDQYRNLMKKGDVIVYMPEYEAYGENQSLLKYDFQYYRIHDPQKISSLPLATMFRYLTSSNVIDSMTYTLTNQIRTSMRGANDKPSDLTEEGDYNVCEGTHDGQTYLGALPVLNKNSAFLRKVREFSEYSKSQGIKFVFAFAPTMYRPGFDSPEWLAASKNLHTVIAEAGISVVGEPRESVAERPFFCNSEYHLNKGGAIRFTNELMAKIKPVLASQVVNADNIIAAP